ncbi:MAG: hypothetical protein IID16_00725 [Candidatus Marinimicrobia bacterium]|nr:hypothetical protein [Candidatus Neomarinimicrobiota bacterium]
MKDLFRSLISDIDAIVDKPAALDLVKKKIWPLAQEKKPSIFFEIGDSEEGKDMQKTLQLNHLIKSYLYLLTNS